MISGAIKGFIAGGVIGFGAIAIASVTLPMRGAPEFSETAPDLSATVTSGRANVPVKVELSADPVPVKSAPVRNAAQKDSDTLVALSVAANAPNVRPQAGEVVVAPESDGTPQSVTPQSDIAAVSAEMPVNPQSQVSVLPAPQTQQAPVAQTSPATPVAPAPLSSDGAFDAPAQPQPQSSGYNQPAAALDTARPTMPVDASRVAADLPTGGTVPTIPQADQQTAQLPAVSTAGADASIAAAPLPVAPAVRSQPVQMASNNTGQSAQPAQPVSPSAPQALQSSGQGETATDDLSSNMPGAGSAKRIILGRTTAPERAPSANIEVIELDNGVSIRRGGVAPTESASAAPAQEPSAPQEIEDRASQSENPLIENAETFENPENKPLMSIVLMDDGTAEFDENGALGGFEDFPYPISFAVNTALPDAQERARAFRKAGFEVLAMVDLPNGALPTDAETTFAVVLPRMPEVVGILEGIDTGFQSSRDVSDQVTAILGQSKLGLVTQAKGLNTMSTLAVKEGVAAVPVFRDFDSKNQSATVIRRFLDQAAFKARQEGAVIMLGRIRPQTTEALVLWGLQDRASSVALAPVSAALRSTQP